MKQCQNPKCGKMFEPNKRRPDQKFCCKQCANQYRYLTIQKPNYKPKENYSCNDRPYTRLTIYLVHKWTAEGVSIVDIARLLNRSVFETAKILQKPLTENEKTRMEKYLKRKEK